jgi:hypothetical protein
MYDLTPPCFMQVTIGSLPFWTYLFANALIFSLQLRHVSGNITSPNYKQRISDKFAIPCFYVLTVHVSNVLSAGTKAIYNLTPTAGKDKYAHHSLYQKDLPLACTTKIQTLLVLENQCHVDALDDTRAP